MARAAPGLEPAPPGRGQREDAMVRTFRRWVLTFTSSRRAGATLAQALELAWRGALPIAGGVGAGFINDLKNNLVYPSGAQTIVPQTATSTVTGAAIDMVDSDGPCYGLLMVGTVSGTSPTLDVKYQECDTSGGTYADISGATHAQVTASSKTSRVNFRRSKRFVKAVGTIAGTTPSFAFAVAIESEKKAV
jgi:hypothetical protein